jgi:hypothetical protein
MGVCCERGKSQCQEMCSGCYQRPHPLHPLHQATVGPQRLLSASRGGFDVFLAIYSSQIFLVTPTPPFSGMGVGVGGDVPSAAIQPPVQCPQDTRG